MAFKNKTKNRNPFNANKTIDAIHNDVLKGFEKNKKHLKNYYHNLDMIKKQILYLRAEIDKDKAIYNNFDLQQKLWSLEDERDRLIDEIDNIENNRDEKEYLLKTGVLLNQYYKIKDNEVPVLVKETEKKGKKKNVKTAKKDVLNWLETNDNENIKYNLKTGKQKIKTKEEVKIENETLLKNDMNNMTKLDTIINTRNNVESIEEKKMLDVLEVDINDSSKKDINELEEEKIEGVKKNVFESMTKKELYNKYMKIVDKNYVDNDFSNVNGDICEYCNMEMLLNQNAGVLICSNCGIQEQIILDSDKPSYKDPPKEMTSFCYKRINHLNEFLAQFQAKETTDIPDEIYNEILVEIKKERIKNMATITPDKMRVILRKIKRNDYYEHIPYIINQLNGLPPPVISSEVEDIIRNMFKEIQIPFEELRPKVIPKRKNFLSYNYVMYKFFELLELDEYLQCFMLLKSRNKLHQQDLIWKHICDALNWQYIPSI